MIFKLKMSEENKDELIEAQKQVIGILFEIIKRYQANSILDEEYFEILSNSTKINSSRIEKILEERKQNSEIVNRLLNQLEI